MVLVRDSEAEREFYRPVRALSMTGLFPGFARPHFVPEYLFKVRGSLNTLYVQHVVDEKIVGFEPADDFAAANLLNVDAGNQAPVSVGDAAVYCYAFGPGDIITGFRGAVAAAITDRFQEIEGKEFAACTAAEFANLEDRLPLVNRRAFDLLARTNRFSAEVWRDCSVFAGRLRQTLAALNIDPEHFRLETRDTGKRLEVSLIINGKGAGEVRQQAISHQCRQLLSRSGLFGANDRFDVRFETSGPPDQLSLLAPGEPEEILSEAKDFLEDKVFLPALRWAGGSEHAVRVVRDTRYWVSRFERIGDLVRYMDRFKLDTRQASLPFLEIKQIRFEDVYAEFVKRFGRFRGYGTSVADFVEGSRYNAFALSIYTRSYNNRGSGIRPVGKLGSHEAVVVNITLAGGKYRNEWLEQGKRLKCYLKAPSRGGEQANEEAHSANRAIMHYPSTPVLVFTRQPGEKDYLYHGVFRYVQIPADEGGKWFDLVKKV